VTDYIAGMTDRYCIRVFEALAVRARSAAEMARYTTRAASASATRSTSST